MKYSFYHYGADAGGMEIYVDEDDDIALSKVCQAIISDQHDSGSFDLTESPTKDVIGYVSSGQGFKFCSNGDILDVPSNSKRGKEIAIAKKRISLQEGIKNCEDPNLRSMYQEMLDNLGK